MGKSVIFSSFVIETDLLYSLSYVMSNLIVSNIMAAQNTNSSQCYKTFFLWKYRKSRFFPKLKEQEESIFK